MMLSYNTLVVLGGVALLGALAGMVGSLAVLRGRALMGDALAHAAFPGLCLAFLVLGRRHLAGMLVGALLSGLAGIAVIATLRRWTRIKEDAAIGIVLSVFFGLGITLSRLIQNRTSEGSKAGLDSYILGKTSGMLVSDVVLIALVAGGALAVVLALFKEFRVLIFDPEFARAQGWPVLRLDWLLMALVAATVIIGLPAVGVVLVAALLILPGAAARFWTDRLSHLLPLAAIFGAAIGVVGAGLSARVSRLPAGPIIVLVGTCWFLVSVFLAPRRGWLSRMMKQRRLTEDRQMRRLLRALYRGEISATGEATAAQLARKNRWSTTATARWMAGLARQELIHVLPDGRIRLSDTGRSAAATAEHGYRLWQAFLQAYPDMAASTVDFDRVSPAGLIPDETLAQLEAAVGQMDVTPPEKA